MHNFSQKIEYQNLAELYKFIPETSNILIVCGSGPESKIASQVYSILSNNIFGVQINSLSIPQGEEAKTLDVAKMLWQMFAKFNLDRHSLVISVGGGSVSDTCGFVCSNYMRGINFIVVPTTLLSMIDAAIGCKNAINTSFGKNMIGTFYKPKLVFIDTNIIIGLEIKQYQNGIFEAIKICFISGEHMFDYLVSHLSQIKCYEFGNHKVIDKFIKLCGIKKDEICSLDLYENKGTRQILNYGHTLAHAIEAQFLSSIIYHGQAVGLGMDFAAFLAKKYLSVSSCIYDKQREIFSKLGLIGSLDELFQILKNADIDKLMSYIKMDKKSKQKSINMMVLKNFGQWEKLSISANELKDNLLEYIKNCEFGEE